MTERFSISGTVIHGITATYDSYACMVPSARTLGVLFYLPHLLPLALSDFSEQLTAVAPVLPSYHLYEPIKAILLYEGRMSNLHLSWSYLFIVGLAALFCSRLLMKKRWLM